MRIKLVTFGVCIFPRSQETWYVLAAIEIGRLKTEIEDLARLCIKTSTMLLGSDGAGIGNHTPGHGPCGSLLGGRANPMDLSKVIFILHQRSHRSTLLGPAPAAEPA